MLLWIFIVGLITAFITSFGIGANDVANSFASSVGAKVLRLRHALVIAAIFEFVGAVFLGSRVTDTVRKKIVDSDAFVGEADVLMLGMLCASASTAIWLLLATWLKAPVSTTHSTIGAVLGFGLVYAWDKENVSEVIDGKAVGLVVASWVLSPLLSGVITAIIFNINKYLALKTQHPVRNSFRIYPFMIGLTVFIILFFIIYKGAPQFDLDTMSLGEAMGISIGSGIGAGILSLVVIRFWLYDRIMRESEEGQRHLNNEQNQEENNQENGENLEMQTVELENPENNDEESNNLEIDTSNRNTKNYHYSEHFKGMKLYDPHAERLYSYLQVVTACASSLAHGSNDVANGIAPLATIYAIYDSGELHSESDVPIWILVLGGVGIVAGLGVWGKRIIDRLGKELSGITPSRGFAIELGAALSVVTASRLELPVSTTHCQVGSIVASGLSDRNLKNVNLKIFGKIVLAWVVTLPITAIISGALFAFAYFSPEKNPILAGINATSI
jgi:sodium-dependent phosphate transporter